MAGFKVDFFKGIRPRISARKLPAGEAQTAQNCKLGSGDIEPWDEKDAGTSLASTYYNRTIYKFDNSGSPVWFEWDSYVDVARGPVKDDSLERTYYTGVAKGRGIPRMTYNTIADGGGGGPYPEDFRYLGIPAPANPPSGLAAVLPESLAAADRKITAIDANAFIINEVRYTVHPGTGTDNQTWRLNSAATGSIGFSFPPGAAYKVTRVISSSQVGLESAETPGVFVVTDNFDKTTNKDWHPMDEQGSTKEADFIGWIIPEGIATITGHKLRKGDVIRISSAQWGATSLEYFAAATTDFFEQGWETERDVYEDGATHKEVRSARVSASAVEGTTQFGVGFSEFYYDVDRTASDASELEDRTYVYTYVSELGEEGPPSPVSNVVAALNGDSVFISSIPGYTESGYDISLARLYRTSSTAAGTEYQFVKEFPIANNFNSTYDTVRGEDLSEVLTTATWFPPDPGMIGITEMANGMLIGFKGKTLFLCEPYFPHAWPAEYDQAVDYDIIGLAAFGNNIAVLTTGYPYILNGSHPRNVNLRPYKINQACMSRQSIATEGDRVYYASPDGLVELSVNGARIVTEKYALKKEWASYEPATMVGAFHDGKYFGFFDGPDNVTQPPRTCALSGTVTSASEDAYRTAGETIILTLTGDTWAAAGTGPIGSTADTQAIIDGLDVVPDTNNNGFNTILSALVPATDVVRTSDTVCTITLPANATFSIDVLETITAIIPAAALVSSAVPITADNGWTITPNSAFTSTLMLSYLDNSGAQQGYVGRVVIDPSGEDRITAPIFESGETTVYPYGGAYSAALDRWLLDGYRFPVQVGLSGRHFFLVSDDNGLTWSRIESPFSTSSEVSAVRRSDQLGYFVTSESSDVWYSTEGLTWSQLEWAIAGTPSMPSRADGHAGITGGSPVFAGNRIWFGSGGSGVTEGGLIRSQDLTVGTIVDTWEFVENAFATTSAYTKFICAGDGKIFLVSDIDETEMCYMDYDASTMSAVSNSLAGTGIVSGLVYGAGIFLGLGSSASTHTADTNSVDPTDASNWTRTTSVFDSGLLTYYDVWYDEGSDGTNGFGFCILGKTNAGALQLYTSPDALTWTERLTIDDLTTELGKSIAGKYPESDLGVTT